MDNEQETQKCCKTCKWYMQYYVKTMNRFDTVNLGHCKNQKKNKIKPRDSFGVCEYWEYIDKNAIKKEREENILNILKLMSKKLAEISTILKHDYEN